MRPFARSLRFVVHVALLGLASRAGTARAEPSADAAAPLRIGLREAMRMGAERGPGVALAAAPRRGIAEARSAADALFLQPPRVSLVFGQRAGDLGPGAELGATVTQDLWTRRLGASRARVAGALGDAQRLDEARARLDAGAQAALAWIAVAEAREVLRLREASLADTRALVATVEARARGGVAMPSEVALAQGELGASEAAWLDGEGMLTEAQFELRWALGLPPTTPIEVDGDPYAVGAPRGDDEAIVREALASHPALAHAAARAEGAREEAKMIGAERAPPISVGASYLREGSGDRVLTGIVTLPLPVVDPGAFDRARQQAAADGADAHARWLRERIAADVRIALHEQAHRREVLSALLAHSRPGMREALRLARAALQAGTQDATAVLLVRQRVLAVEEQVVRAASDVRRADVRLALAAGRLAP